MTVLLAPLLGISTAAAAYFGPIGPSYYRNIRGGTTSGTDEEFNANYRFPLVALGAPIAVGIVALPSATITAAAGAGWLAGLVVERVRHVRADAGGCCRDEERIRAAERAGLLEIIGTRFEPRGRFSSSSYRPWRPWWCPARSAPRSP